MRWLQSLFRVRGEGVTKAAEEQEIIKRNSGEWEVKRGKGL